jgi:hypothetical protein
VRLLQQRVRFWLVADVSEIASQEIRHLHGYKYKTVASSGLAVRLRPAPSQVEPATQQSIAIMASSSNAPKDKLFAAAEKIHRELAKELNKHPQIKSAIRMAFITSAQDDIESLNEAVRTKNEGHYDFTWDTIFYRVSRLNECSIDQIKLPTNVLKHVVEQLSEREHLVKEYLTQHVEPWQQPAVRHQLMKELDVSLGEKLTG